MPTHLSVSSRLAYVNMLCLICSKHKTELPVLEFTIAYQQSRVGISAAGACEALRSAAWSLASSRGLRRRRRRRAFSAAACALGRCSWS